MLGKTNCKAAKQQPCELINLTIQSDDASFPGASFTVSYGEYSKTYTWEGGVMTIEVPAYVEYTISFGTVDGFITPDSVTYTAQTGNSRTVTATYTPAVEKLTVNVSGISSGYTVTVVNATSGATIGTQTATSKTYSIEEGTKYYVTASSVSGYVSPSNSSTYTAVAGNARSVAMAYVAHSGTLSPSNGVYIQDTDGYFHTESEWDGTYTANGIAVVTSNCRFVMALENAYSSRCQWGSYGTEVTGIVTATSPITASTDYAGESNTTTILNQLGNSSSTDDAPAAYYCRAYTFPNGATGYMGAYGEWQAALDNKDAIVSALSKCGGTAMATYYWTSTQHDSNHAYIETWSSGSSIPDDSKDAINFVRAFASI